MLKDASIKCTCKMQKQMKNINFEQWFQRDNIYIIYKYFSKYK